MPEPKTTVRQAATVVIIRPGTQPNTDEILMLRRSAASPFMPDAMVFPGGRVDADDGPKGQDSSFAVAACRECREEANLALAAGEIRWFDTWTTPSAENRRRFTARFFWARIDAARTQSTMADGHETHDAVWAPAQAYLDRWRAAEIDLPPPTACVLLQLASAESMRSLQNRAADPLRTPVLPKVVPHEDGRNMVVMPHDPEYSDLPGEGVEIALERVLDLPRRFVRAKDVWQPLEPGPGVP